jgi:hypothetical protein
VKADEVDGRVKSARQEGVRALRDRSELFDEGAANVIKFGPHRFFVNTQPMELSILPRDGGLALHLSGTDFFEPLEDPALLSAKDLWDQSLPSETPEIYRGEFLAALMLREAERGTAGFTLTQLREDALTDGGLLSRVRQFSAERHDEGYERGVHDVDTAHILDKLLALTHTAGVLRHEGHARALGVLYAARLDEPARALVPAVVAARGAFARSRRGPRDARARRRDHPHPRRGRREARLTTTPDERVRAARYLVEELSGDRVRFALAGDAAALCAAFLQSLAGGRRALAVRRRPARVGAHPSEPAWPW